MDCLYAIYKQPAMNWDLSKSSFWRNVGKYSKKGRCRESSI